MGKSIEANGTIKNIDIEIDGKLFVSDIKIIEHNGKVKFVGNIIKGSHENLIGFFSSEYDFDQNEMTEIEIYEFDNPLLFIADRFDEPQVSKKNIFYAPIILDDGSLIFFSQVYYKFTEYHANGSLIVYHSYEDLHISKINNKMDIEWTHHIPIKTNHNRSIENIGFSYLFDEKQLDLIHAPIIKDGEKNNAKITISSISQEGDMSTNDILIDEKTKQISYSSDLVLITQKEKKLNFIVNVKKKQFKIVSINF